MYFQKVSPCDPNCKRSLRSGYTLLELLAAIALASILMVAILGVLQSMTSRQKLLLADIKNDPWLDRFSSQLEWDLVNSREIQTTTDEIRLIGFSGSKPKSGQRLHNPAVICYRVSKLNSLSLLFRQEVHVDAQRTTGHKTELVGTGIVRMRVLANAAKTDAQASRISLESPEVADGVLPPQVTVELLSEGENSALFTRSYLLR